MRKVVMGFVMDSIEEHRINRQWDFCINAILDVVGSIRSLDTKIAIILGALSAIFAAIYTITWSPRVPHGYSNSLLESVGNVWFLTAVATFALGLFAISVRGPRKNVPQSHWFFATKGYSNPEEYVVELFELSELDLLKEIANELYKLNDLYRRKAPLAKWTVYLFALFAGVSIWLVVLRRACNW